MVTDQREAVSCGSLQVAPRPFSASPIVYASGGEGGGETRVLTEDDKCKKKTQPESYKRILPNITEEEAGSQALPKPYQETKRRTRPYPAPHTQPPDQ